jgi:hypothetical protein
VHLDGGAIEQGEAAGNNPPGKGWRRDSGQPAAAVTGRPRMAPRCRGRPPASPQSNANAPAPRRDGFDRQHQATTGLFSRVSTRGSYRPRRTRQCFFPQEQMTADPARSATASDPPPAGRMGCCLCPQSDRHRQGLPPSHQPELTPDKRSPQRFDILPQPGLRWHRRRIAARRSNEWRKPTRR